MHTRDKNLITLPILGTNNKIFQHLDEALCALLVSMNFTIPAYVQINISGLERSRLLRALQAAAEFHTPSSA